MAESERSQCFDVAIPQDAVEIRVTNIVNPYIIRIQELPEDRTAKSNLSRELQAIKKVQLKENSQENYTPSVGDDVLLSSDRFSKVDIDLPDWICRGVITDTAMQTSDVFLLDYGIVINVPTDSLIKYYRKSVIIEPLTMTVGLYNIFPLDSSTWRISELWPNNTLNFIKGLIKTAKKMYFEVLAFNRKRNKKFGDIYLVIDDKNISLIKTLILCSLAVKLYPELLRAIKNTDTTDEILIPYDTEQVITGTCNESPTKASICNKLSSSRITDYRSKNKKINQKILISTKILCRPLEHSEDAKFTSEIHKALKIQGVRTLKQIQSYMWPAIKQGLNTVAISPHGTGKSVGYIVPIANNIAVNEEIIVNKQKKDIVTKPVALFMCATLQKCIDVADMCNKVLLNGNIKYSAMYNGLSEKTIMASICNKFHILISTPPFLLRTIEKYSNKLDLSDVSYLVIDQADILLNKYFMELIKLIKNYKMVKKGNKNSIQNGLVQIIVAAQNWTDKVQLFVEKYMEDPYICIGSFVEAAAFSRVRGQMLIRRSNEKKDQVLKFLDDYPKVKTLIFCLNSEEAIELNDFLTSKSVQTLLVHENIPITKVNEIKEDWHKYIPGTYPVIICTDQVLADLQISNIELLIHYSLTNTSKTLFGRRFSVIMDNWLTEPKIDCKVIILFDESKGNKHFKGVVDILKRLNVSLPEDWKQIAEGLDLAYDKTIKNYPLCESIKSFGTCENNSCSYRHSIISEVDTPKLDVTIGDELKLEIIHVHHASHFSARIYEATRICEITGKKKSITYPFKAIELNNAMIKYYSEPHHRRGYKDLCVGQKCAYRKPEQDYTRVLVLKIIEKDIRTDKPKKVQVQSLDDGQIFSSVYVSELFELPDMLLNYKCTVVDVFLTGVAPFDHEYEWTNLATDATKVWIKNNCNNSLNSYAYVKVLLHIGNAIWTNSVVSRSKLIGYNDIESSTLNAALIKKELATTNEDHLPQLLTMCNYGGITEVNGCPLKVLEQENKKSASVDECD